MKYAMAVDIGGTTTSFGVVDEEGNILCKDLISTKEPEGIDAYLAVLHRKMHIMLEKTVTDGPIAGIGIGAPCANHETGEIEGATDLPWPSPIPLKKIFELEFGLPVAVANDAKAAAIGEMCFGAAKGLKNFIMLTLGTGVGSGIVCDGRLLSGSRGFAGELGHVSVSDGRKRLCKCGRHDCLQNYCSASGIVDTAKIMLKESDEPSTLRNIREADLTAKSICDNAVKGDSLSRKVFEFTGMMIGKACASFAAFTDPDAFIFFGGVANAFDLMEPSIRKSMEENILFLYKDRIKLLRSSLSEADAALLGASALAFEKNQGEL